VNAGVRRHERCLLLAGSRARECLYRSGVAGRARPSLRTSR
jgi:hypothetical protein